METQVKYGIEYTYIKSEIVKMINRTLDKIKKVIKDNDYQISGDIDKYYNLEWKHLSGNQMKNIQKYCIWIERKPTLKRINSFFSLLSRYFGIERVHVKVSLKEEKIQKARKEWLKARNEAERLLNIYKEEKGDFYKMKILFNK